MQYERKMQFLKIENKIKQKIENNFYDLNDNLKDKLFNMFKFQTKYINYVCPLNKDIIGVEQRNLILNNNDVFKNYENIYDINIILCTCIYGRKELTFNIINYFSEMNFSKIIIAYSNEEDRENLMNISSKLVFVKSDNKPISKKWNVSILKSKEYPHDAVMISGSDDIISPYYLDKCKLYIKNNFDYITNNKWLSFLVEYNIICYSRYIRRATYDGLGSGRVIHKNILKKINYNIYNFDLNKGLDGSSFKLFYKNIKKVAYDIYPNPVICITLNNNREGLTVQNNYLSFIKKCYRSKNCIMTIDKIITNFL